MNQPPLCFSSLPVATKRYYYPKRITSDETGIERLRAQSVEEQDRFWRIVEDRIAQFDGPFLYGEDFSLVDIQLAMLVPWYPDEISLLGSHPRIRRCYEAVASRPIAGRIMAEHGSLEIFE